MANQQHTQGGTHQQHVNAGQQSHKNAQGKDQAGQHDQSAKAKEQNNQDHTRGGSHEQHVRAGEQSHKNR